MDLSFERGDSQHPKGHALVYFRVNTEPDRVYATYVVTLPVKADLAKYVPPFLASHLGNLPLSDFSAFAMPPVPEPVASYHELELLSRLRDDDLVFGTSMFSFDLPRMMEAVTEAVQAYSRLCAGLVSGAAAPELSPSAEGGAEQRPGAQAPADDRGFGVNEVLFSLLSEGDKLGELARLLSKLRFAVEGRDTSTANEAAEEITTLARYLPEDFQVLSLLSAARDMSPKSSRLAQLYLDRCFRLSAGDVSSARSLEEQIRGIKAQE